MTIKELREKTNLSQQQFADYFNIPKPTLQQWEQGRRIPPTYVTSMMERILRLENRI